jgi:hypothetical protein
MEIDELNKLIKECKEIFFWQLSIDIEETFPNVHPTIKNPLNYLNDRKVSFSYLNVTFGCHLLSKMESKDFFDELDKLVNEPFDPVFSRYTNWKQKELREYKLNQLLNE